MSGKSPGVAHRALDEIIKFKTSLIVDVGKFKTDVLKAIGDIVASVSEVQTKHNDLAANLSAVEGMTQNIARFVASELGKMGGSVQRHLQDLDKSTSAIDLNVLALAELSKEVIGQLTQVDALISRLHEATAKVITGPKEASDLNAYNSILELSGTDVMEIKTTAEKWYGDLVASSFKTVRARMEAEDVARREREELDALKAKEAAEAAAANVAESQTMAAELLKANSSDMAVAANTSGGPGSPFPEGAEIFGS
jgi:hypothetical protein